MPTGICKFCLNEKELVSSHLLPAKLYEYCRVAGLSPIKIGAGMVLPTDRQLRDYLLCKVCEDVLSGDGETWVNPKLATWEQTFPLYDLLTKRPPDREGDGLRIYFARRNPEVAVDKLVHFALGIFWKASVHSWSGTSKAPLIQLGPYSDGIRRWLRSEADFPKHVYLRAVVASPKAAQIALTGPYETPRDTWHHFFLHVPGLALLLDVGKTVGEAERSTCFYNDLEHPIVVYDEFMRMVSTMMVTEMKKSRKTNAYVRAIQKVREKRR